MSFDYSMTTSWCGKNKEKPRGLQPSYKITDLNSLFIKHFLGVITVMDNETF